MKRYMACGIAALLLVGGCTPGSTPSGNKAPTSVAPVSRGAGSSHGPNPQGSRLSLEQPADVAKIMRMLTVQGFTQVHIGADGISVDVPACPRTMWANLGEIKDGRLSLIFTNDGTDFLEVSGPPDRQELDAHGLCELKNLS